MGALKEIGLKVLILVVFAIGVNIQNSMDDGFTLIELFSQWQWWVSIMLYGVAFALMDYWKTTNYLNK